MTPPKTGGKILVMTNETKASRGEKFAVLGLVLMIALVVALPLTNGAVGMIWQTVGIWIAQLPSVVLGWLASL